MSCVNRPAPNVPTTLAIVGGTVIHPQRDAAPAGSVAIPAGATVVDARGKWIVPGLIDAHVHFFQSGISIFAFTLPLSLDQRH